MGELTQLLDRETTDEVFEGLARFWSEHPEAILKGPKGLTTLANPMGQKLDFLEKIRKTLEAFTMGIGNVNLEIHRLGRSSGMKVEGGGLDLGRFVLVLGSPAFFETAMPTSGAKTGRAPTYKRVLHNGEAFMPMGDEVKILSDAKTTVFEKGKGRVTRSKPEFFDQFILIAAITLQDVNVRELSKKFKDGRLEDMAKGKGLAAALTEVLKHGQKEASEESEGFEEFAA